MNNKQSREYMDDWLELQPKKVKDNLKVISNEDCPVLLRIDYKTPKVLIPRLPEKAAPSENNSCPRVSMAPHLFGCVIGYSIIVHEHIAGAADDVHNGSYSISTVEYQHAVVPNRHLVYDARISEEVWLVPYSPQYKEYKPKVIGSLFIKRSSIERVRSGINRIVAYYTYIEINTPVVVDIGKGKSIQKGYYQATFVDNGSRDVYKASDLIYREITKEEYLEASQIPESGNYTPALESIPAWAIW